MMTVIVTTDTPPAIRGLLKRWFIEPKPHVFVGTVSQRVQHKVLEYIRRNAPGMGMLVIGTDHSSQGFTVESYGQPDRYPVKICGIHLIAETFSGKLSSDSTDSQNS